MWHYFADHCVVEMVMRGVILYAGLLCISFFLGPDKTDDDWKSYKKDSWWANDDSYNSWYSDYNGRWDAEHERKWHASWHYHSDDEYASWHYPSDDEQCAQHAHDD